MNAQVEMFMYAQRARGRSGARDPRDDIITALLDAEVDGDTLSEMDFNLFFLLIAVAGNETTRNSISHGIHAFCDYPEQYQLLVTDPTLAQSATEEIVRWASPVMYFRRNVTKDTELRGQQLKDGDKVSIWYISANRDEDVFDDPFTFDIRRDPNEHVGFGGGGPHHCLGANLARMEIYVLLEEMAQPHADASSATGDAEPLRSNFIAGIKHMPSARFRDLSVLVVGLCPREALLDVGVVGRPSRRSAMMLRSTSLVPPPTVSAGLNRKPRSPRLPVDAPRRCRRASLGAHDILREREHLLAVRVLERLAQRRVRPGLLVHRRRDLRSWW